MTNEAINIQDQLINQHWQEVQDRMNAILNRVVVIFDQMPKEISPESEQVLRPLRMIRSELAQFDDACNVILNLYEHL